LKSLVIVFVLFACVVCAHAQDAVEPEAIKSEAICGGPVLDYLAAFDAMPDQAFRNPFGPISMQRTDPKPVAVKEVEPKEPESVVFDGSRISIREGDLGRLPAIKVTGLMEMGGRMAASATIEKLGSRVLRVNDKILLGDAIQGGGEETTKWIVIKRIGVDGMTVVLDDNTEITGKYF
jgi:hypothetical protein